MTSYETRALVMTIVFIIAIFAWLALVTMILTEDASFDSNIHVDCHGRGGIVLYTTSQADIALCVETPKILHVYRPR